MANPIGVGSASVAQIYGGIQGRGKGDSASARTSAPVSPVSDFRLPQNATPRGERFLEANINPQEFDSNAQRGSYLNIVV